MAGLNLDFLDPSKNPNLFRKLAAGGLSGALTLAAGGRGDQALGTALDTTSEIANQDVDMGLRRAKEMGEQQDRAIRSRQVAVQESENFRNQRLFQEGARDKALQTLQSTVPNFNSLPSEEKVRLLEAESRRIGTGTNIVKSTEYERTNPIANTLFGKVPIIGKMTANVQPKLNKQARVKLENAKKILNKSLYSQNINASEYKSKKMQLAEIERQLRESDPEQLDVSKSTAF